MRIFILFFAACISALLYILFFQRAAECTPAGGKPCILCMGGAGICVCDDWFHPL